MDILAQTLHQRLDRFGLIPSRCELANQFKVGLGGLFRWTSLKWQSVLSAAGGTGNFVTEFLMTELTRD